MNLIIRVKEDIAGAKEKMKDGMMKI